MPRSGKEHSRQREQLRENSSKLNQIKIHKKENYRSIALIKIEAKILNRMNKLSQTACRKGLYTMVMCDVAREYRVGSA